MNCIGTKLSKNFAWELGFLYKLRDFSDGIDFFDLKINYDRFKGDHNPQFGVCLVIMNFLIFQFEIYNVNHVLEDE